MKTWFSPFLFFGFPLKGEELKKLIGAPIYIECSSKTQQVCTYNSNCFKPTRELCHGLITEDVCVEYPLCECRMWKQCLMPPLKWFSSPQSRRRKRRERHRRPALYCNWKETSVFGTQCDFSHLSINLSQTAVTVIFFDLKEAEAEYGSFDW